MVTDKVPAQIFDFPAWYCSSLARGIQKSMIFAVLLGILLATGNASATVAAAVIVVSIIAHAFWEIAFETMPVTGAKSPYALFVQNLEYQGDMLDHRPWLSYMVQSCLFWIPFAFVAYFAMNYLRSA